MEGTVLVVDDELDIQISLKGILEDEGYKVLICGSGEEALEVLLKESDIDIIFLDIWLTGMDGLDVLDIIRKKYSDIPVIMISGHGNIETAVQSMKMGAFDYIEKPLSLEKIIVTAQKALEFRKLQLENQDLRSKVRGEYIQEITGKSEAVKRLKAQIEKVAPTDAWVLITGENGTGKEIVARAIHKRSKRSKRPMIAINCAAIPEELIESELFGHEKGAFTGADRVHIGKFELAHKGTLFLDEIGDMSLKTQAKILRILQEQCFERVGGTKTIKVDVRVIVATNKDLKKEIEAGRFREDLYYRLNVFPIHVPALRERREDIPLLIDEFITSFCKENGYKPIRISNGALKALMSYFWPGNVRELKNLIERLLIMYAGEEITEDRLPPEIKVEKRPLREGDLTIRCLSMDFKKAKAEFEKEFLRVKLQEVKGNVSKLSEVIGLERSYIHKKLKLYGIHNGDIKKI